MMAATRPRRNSTDLTPMKLLLKDSLCPICHQIYCNAMITSCSHQMCRYCFMTSQKKENNGHGCPVCHKKKIRVMACPKIDHNIAQLCKRCSTKEQKERQIFVNHRTLLESKFELEEQRIADEEEEQEGELGNPKAAKSDGRPSTAIAGVAQFGERRKSHTKFNTKSPKSSRPILKTGQEFRSGKEDPVAIGTKNCRSKPRTDNLPPPPPKTEFKTLEELQKENDRLMEKLNLAFDDNLIAKAYPKMSTTNFCQGDSIDMKLASSETVLPPLSKHPTVLLTPMHEKSISQHMDHFLNQGLPPEILTHAYDKNKARDLLKSANDIQNFLKDTSLERFINNEPSTGSEDAKSYQHITAMLKNAREIQTYLQELVPQICDRDQEAQQLISDSDQFTSEEYIQLLDNAADYLESKIEELKERRKNMDPDEDRTPEETFPRTPFGPKGEVLVPQFTYRGDFRQAQVSAVGELFRKEIYSSTEAFKPHQHLTNEGRGHHSLGANKMCATYAPLGSGPPKPKHHTLIGCPGCDGDSLPQTCPCLTHGDFSIAKLNAKFQQENQQLFRGSQSEGPARQNNTRMSQVQPRPRTANPDTKLGNNENCKQAKANTSRNPTMPRPRIPSSTTSKQCPENKKDRKF